MMIHERRSDILLFWSSGLALIEFLYCLAEYLNQHANEIEEFIRLIFNAFID